MCVVKQIDKYEQAMENKIKFVINNNTKKCKNSESAIQEKK